MLVTIRKGRCAPSGAPGGGPSAEEGGPPPGAAGRGRLACRRRLRFRADGCERQGRGDNAGNGKRQNFLHDTLDSCAAMGPAV